MNVVNSHILPSLTFIWEKTEMHSMLFRTVKHAHVNQGGQKGILPGKKYGGGVGKGSSTFDKDSIYEFEDDLKK